MAFLSGFNNANLIDNCQNLFNLTVQLQVTEDLVTLGDTGFSLQLNCYPQIGSTTPNSTPQTGGGSLTWFQYVLIVANNQISFEIQYWATGTHSYQTGGPGGNPPEIRWPPGYTPNPTNTSPWLPVFPNVAVTGTVVGSTSSNHIPAGSVLTIQLATDASGNVTGAKFSFTDPSGNVQTGSTQPWQQYAGQSEPANYALYPIYGFQVDLVSPPSSACTFTSGAGTLTYSVSSGALSVQTVNTCGGSQPGTGENSNIVYQGVSPASGSTVSQSFAAPAMSMAFNFDKSTFGQNEVTQTPTWGAAYWLAISGFPNQALGFNSPSALNGPPNPSPTITAAISSSLNPGLTAGQIATIANNLPVVGVFGPPPVQAIDDTLGLNYQTFFCPFTISFLDMGAFNALNQHQVAIVTLTANLTVQVPTGVDSNGNVVTTGVQLNAQANIELAKGEDPYFIDLNPNDPQAYPTWLSFDLRLFTVTPTQSHQMFSVPNPTDASLAVPYIQAVLNHLNNPSLITNGDTFDNALTQDEEGSAIVFFPNDDSFVPAFNFAVARVRIKSSITTTIGPVRVFFRLFNAASTVSDFAEVGTGEGTYRWGTNGTPGHKIPLLGVQGGFLGIGAEYVTVPCFATQRVNLTSPADMNTQTDPTNAVPITTAAGEEVDTYFGCWLDVNQTTPFLIPIPPLLPSQWDGPWTGTESLNGVISTAPHQCLIAEIRFDDTPIPKGATSATSDKLAQRNIAWLGTQP
jgi:hypothetical protein